VAGGVNRVTRWVNEGRSDEDEQPFPGVFGDCIGHGFAGRLFGDDRDLRVCQHESLAVVNVNGGVHRAVANDGPRDRHLLLPATRPKVTLPCINERRVVTKKFCHLRQRREMNRVTIRGDMRGHVERRTARNLRSQVRLRRIARALLARCRPQLS